MEPCTPNSDWEMNIIDVELFFDRNWIGAMDNALAGMIVNVADNRTHSSGPHRDLP